MRVRDNAIVTRSRGALALFAAALLFALASYAAKQPARSASGFAANGEWLFCKNVVSTKEDGENRSLAMTITGKLTGTIVGNYEGAERAVARKDGSSSFSGSGTLTAEVNGRSGSAVLTYSGTVDREGDVRGDWVIDQGSDGMARLDGRGALQGKRVKGACAPADEAFNGKYTGILQFAGQ